MYSAKSNKLSFDEGLNEFIDSIVKILSTHSDININSLPTSKLQILEMMKETDRNNSNLDEAIHRKKMLLIAIARLPRESKLELGLYFSIIVLSLVKDLP